MARLTAARTRALAGVKHAYLVTRREGRAPAIVPVRPIQVTGLHVWNLLLWQQGHADADRECA